MQYKPGERVTSRVGGYYMGMPARVVGKAHWQINRDTIYVLELETGKRISLKQSQIERKE